MQVLSLCLYITKVLLCSLFVLEENNEVVVLQPGVARGVGRFDIFPRQSYLPH